MIKQIRSRRPDTNSPGYDEARKVFSHAAVFGLFFVSLQYLQQIMGYSPLVSGLAVLPMVAAFVLSPASNHLSERLGPAPVIAGGLVLSASGMGALATLGVD